MPSQEPGRSPVMRSQLSERPSSSNSVYKELSKGGQLLNTHKGSSTRLHKSHGIGHGRSTHTRVPSHGKGLNKLSKLGQGNAAEIAGHIRHHRRSASLTPSSSPGSLSSKRNSSTISLQRPSSKGSAVKRNASHPVMKLGNQPKSEKSQVKRNLLKKRTHDAPIPGTARFEVGDDAQDNDWTEDSSSQSPATTRTNSRPKTPVTPAPKEIPTPDEPRARLSPQLPHSPPGSPKLNGQGLQNPKIRCDEDHKHALSHPPDAQAVTSRLLSRNGAHVTPPKTSNISANITPHPGTPHLDLGFGATSTQHEPSMPANGISRFLSRTNSTPGSVTPGSVSLLYQNLADLEHRPKSPARDPSPREADARRVRSAANLTHVRLSNDENTSPSTSPNRDDLPLRPKPRTRNPTAFESARGINPSAGKSYTQLKINLDREASSREPPVFNHPLLSTQGSMLNLAGGISINAGDMEKRVKRQYVQAQHDVGNCRRYYPDLITGKVPERAVRKYELSKGKERRGREKKTPSIKVGSAETAKSVPQPTGTGEGVSGTQGRGRVRSEVGNSGSFERRSIASEECLGDGGVEALLRRMWMAPESTELGEGD